MERLRQQALNIDSDMGFDDEANLFRQAADLIEALTQQQEQVEGEVRMETHLLEWLPGAYDHCKYGSRDWCEDYLNNAVEVIKSYQALVARLTKERDEAVEYAATSTSAKLESANGALTQQLTEKDTEIKRLRESLSNAAYWLDHAGYGMAADNARAALNGGAK